MTGFLGELYAGRFRWDLIHPFPAQDRADRAAGAAARSALSELLERAVDPDLVDTDRVLPEGLEADLAAGGFLALAVPGADGGLGLSPLNVFRVLETAAARCGAVGMLLAWHNVLGVGAFPELLGSAGLRELVAGRLAGGAVGGFGDSEPGGAANSRRATVAVPTTGGYLLTGEKLFVGNGSNAHLITVSATVRDGHDERIELFLVDTASEGFSVVGVHDLVGLAGSPIAALRLDRVFVPAAWRLSTPTGGWRSSPPTVRRTAFARMAITVTQTLAQARACLGWCHDFLQRRRDMNGRPLAEYDAVQRRLAASLADVFAVDSVVEWSLSGGPDADRLAELNAAKNIGTLTSWRVIERTVSLLGGEGVERAASKARRGAPPLPVERAWRDARCLRVAGGVDFNIDLRAAWSGIFAPMYAAGPPGEPPAVAGPARPPVAPAGLSTANQRHLAYVSDQVTALRQRCVRLAAGHDADRLAERQEVLISVNRIADELFTMSAVLARAARLAAAEHHPQRLAEVYCSGGRRRIGHHWHTLDTLDDGTDHAGLCRDWLAGAVNL